VLYFAAFTLLSAIIMHFLQRRWFRSSSRRTRQKLEHSIIRQLRTYHTNYDASWKLNFLAKNSESYENNILYSFKINSPKIIGNKNITINGTEYFSRDSSVKNIILKTLFTKQRRFLYRDYIFILCNKNTENHTNFTRSRFETSNLPRLERNLSFIYRWVESVAWETRGYFEDNFLNYFADLIGQFTPRKYVGKQLADIFQPLSNLGSNGIFGVSIVYFRNILRSVVGHVGLAFSLLFGKKTTPEQTTELAHTRLIRDVNFWMRYWLIFQYLLDSILEYFFGTSLFDKKYIPGLRGAIEKFLNMLNQVLAASLTRLFSGTVSSGKTIVHLVGEMVNFFRAFLLNKNISSAQEQLRAIAAGSLDEMSKDIKRLDSSVANKIEETRKAIIQAGDAAMTRTQQETVGQNSKFYISLGHLKRECQSWIPLLIVAGFCLHALNASQARKTRKLWTKIEQAWVDKIISEKKAVNERLGKIPEYITFQFKLYDEYKSSDCKNHLYVKRAYRYKKEVLKQSSVDSVILGKYAEKIEGDYDKYQIVDKGLDNLYNDIFYRNYYFKIDIIWGQHQGYNFEKKVTATPTVTHNTFSPKPIKLANDLSFTTFNVDLKSAPENGSKSGDGARPWMQSLKEIYRLFFRGKISPSSGKYKNLDNESDTVIVQDIILDESATTRLYDNHIQYQALLETADQVNIILIPQPKTQSSTTEIQSSSSQSSPDATIESKVNVSTSSSSLTPQQEVLTIKTVRGPESYIYWIQEKQTAYPDQELQVRIELVFKTTKKNNTPTTPDNVNKARLGRGLLSLNRLLSGKPRSGEEDRKQHDGDEEHEDTDVVFYLTLLFDFLTQNRIGLFYNLSQLRSRKSWWRLLQIVIAANAMLLPFSPSMQESIMEGIQLGSGLSDKEFFVWKEKFMAAYEGRTSASSSQLEAKILTEVRAANNAIVEAHSDSLVTQQLLSSERELPMIADPETAMFDSVGDSCVEEIGNVVSQERALVLYDQATELRGRWQEAMRLGQKAAAIGAFVSMVALFVVVIRSQQMEKEDYAKFKESINSIKDHDSIIVSEDENLKNVVYACKKHTASARFNEDDLKKMYEYHVLEHYFYFF
jgi:hypothetical protein